LNVTNKWRKVHFKPGELDKFKTLTFRVEKTWNPLLAGFNDDPRDLGIYMIVPEIEIKQPEIGFVHEGTSKGGVP